MISRIFDTIIVGAGISGLACARHLQNSSKDFLVVSKDIGGRILTSKEGANNYGAFFVCSDYYNVLKYVKLGSRIKLCGFSFHDNSDIYGLFEPKLIPYFYQFIKILKLLYKFRKAFRAFRKAAHTISQKIIIENNAFLHNLYMKNAADFVLENKLQAGTDTYLSKALYSTTFSTIYEMNAFSYLQFLLPLITPIYTFTFEKEKMIKPFQDKIILDCVTDIHFKNGQYKIKTNNDIFYSKNIVLATSIRWSRHFADVKKTNKPVNTHMLHIRGIPKKIVAQKRYHLFAPHNNVQAIANPQNGTFLVYYKDTFPFLKKYFFKPHIIASHIWKPAGTINGHILIECNRGNNMYLIGDYNVADLEESYVTGIYSANQIIQSYE